jgi:hypothetical protein
MDRPFRPCENREGVRSQTLIYPFILNTVSHVAEQMTQFPRTVRA